MLTHVSVSTSSSSAILAQEQVSAAVTLGIIGYLERAEEGGGYYRAM